MLLILRELYVHAPPPPPAKDFKETIFLQREWLLLLEKITGTDRVWQLTPVIPATGEVEIRRMMI
jgi:hypothetical protein